MLDLETRDWVAYKIICESNGINISHSRKGNPLDYAVIESFHSIFKKETIYSYSINRWKNTSVST